MPKFVIKDAQQPTETIEFTTRIDDDGDFMVSANGVDLFYIDSLHGDIHKLYVDEEYRESMSGLKFFDDRIAISE